MNKSIKKTLLNNSETKVTRWNSTCRKGVRSLSYQVLMLTMIATVMAIPGQSAAEEGISSAEYGVVLNLSGKQRMLTQKMSKETMLIALNWEKDANLGNLTKTSALFDRTLKGLRDGDEGLGLPPTSSKRIIRQLDKTAELWKPFHEKIKAVISAGSASADDVKFIAENNIPLLKNMNRCVKLYEADASKAGLKSDPGLAVTINLSGKQRMLTQKMSKEFLLVAYGHEQEATRLTLRETATLFERTLKGLQNGDETLDLPGTKPEHILAQLATVDSLWKDFKPHIEFAMSSENTSIPEEKIANLAAKNLPLLSEMNKAVKLYEKEAAK